MKKIILALSLTIIFTISAFAGNTPIMGYSGCPGGAWYPDSQVCCMPDLECPVGLAAPVPSNNTNDKILIELIAMLKNIYF